MSLDFVYDKLVPFRVRADGIRQLFGRGKNFRFA